MVVCARLRRAFAQDLTLPSSVPGVGSSWLSLNGVVVRNGFRVLTTAGNDVDLLSDSSFFHEEGDGNCLCCDCFVKILLTFHIIVYKFPHAENYIVLLF